MPTTRVSTTSIIGSITMLICVLVVNEGVAQRRYERKIRKDRKAKDIGLASKKFSPLQEEDRLRFDGLHYFDVDPTWKREANISLIRNGDTLDFMTTSGKVKQFYAYAQYRFFNGQREDTLIGYIRVRPGGEAPTHKPYVFLPFKDETTGNQSYGGGRYLDLPVPSESGSATIDFNRCYNPYCAYGGGFSCPIPPVGNYVNARIEAGEKAYDDH